MKYKIGDIVMGASNNFDSIFDIVGKIGKVVGICSQSFYPYTVKFKEIAYLHINGKEVYVDYFRASNIKPITSIKLKLLLKD